MIKLYSKIRIITDKYSTDGVPLGTVGTVLDVYDSGDIEVQFEDAEGNSTDIFFAVCIEDVEPQCSEEL